MRDLHRFTSVGSDFRRTESRAKIKNIPQDALCDPTDALYRLLKLQGVICRPEVGQTNENARTFVVEFPVASPVGAIYATELSALDQLEYWRTVKTSYTDHNPSVTITVRESEWIDVLAWLKTHWNIIGGLSFLPRDDHVYQLAPYEAIDQAEYTRLLTSLRSVDLSLLPQVEREDGTDADAKRVWACGRGGDCD